jgi:transposase
VKTIRRATRKRHSSEENIQIVLDGLRGESSIAQLCRREGIAEGLYYAWSKEFLEAGKRRLAGDTARAATSGEVKDLRREAQELKAVVAEQALELRLLKKRMARPVASGFFERAMIGLHQRIRPRTKPGQDGDTRVPVLINFAASGAVFLTRFPERRSTVRPSRFHRSQTPSARQRLIYAQTGR